MNKDELVNKYFNLNDKDNIHSVIMYKEFFNGFIEEFVGANRFINMFCNDDLTININLINNYIFKFLDIQYQKYEFCKSKNCSELEDNTCKSSLKDCKFTAKDFHDWLIKNDFNILKNKS